ncbi:hypothetical protein ACJX0J_034739, partial [Zea mays]
SKNKGRLFNICEHILKEDYTDNVKMQYNNQIDFTPATYLFFPCTANIVDLASRLYATSYLKFKF